MYVRLTQPGFTTLTGMFGSFHFTDGVSDADLSEQLYNGLKAMVACEPADLSVPADAPADAE